MSATPSFHTERQIARRAQLDGWSSAQLRELCSTGSGTTPSRRMRERYYSNGSIPWVKTLDLNNGEVWEPQEMVTPSALEECSLTRYPAGTVLVAMYGGLNQIGRTGLLRIPAAVNQAITAIQPAASKLLPEYLLAALNLHVGYWKSVASSSRKDPNITRDDVRRFPILHPQSIDEQRDISRALSDVDALIGGLDKLIAKKRAIKAAATQNLLSGKIRLPGFASSWRNARLGDVIEGCSSGSTPSRSRPNFFNGTIRWITSGELNYTVVWDTKEKITEQARRSANLKMVPAGTFLMAITGLEAEGTRGACALVGAASTTNQSCMAIFPTEDLLPDYLFHYYVWKGKELAVGYCQGTKQQSYTAKIVRQLPIHMPNDVGEQRAIAALLSDINANITALERRRDKTISIKQGMMQQLLTGRIRLMQSEVVA